MNKSVFTNLEEFFERLESSRNDSMLVLVRWNRAGGAQSYLHVTEKDLFKGFCEALPPGTNVVVFEKIEPPSLMIANALEPVVGLITGYSDWRLIDVDFKSLEAIDRPTKVENENTWGGIESNLPYHLPFYEIGEFVYELEEIFPIVKGKQIAFYSRVPSWDTDPSFEIFIDGIRGVY